MDIYKFNEIYVDKMFINVTRYSTLLYVYNVVKFGSSKQSYIDLGLPNVLFGKSLEEIEEYILKLTKPFEERKLILKHINRRKIVDWING